MTPEEIEQHWQYTEAVIDLMLNLTEMLYKAAMAHGAKHQSEDKPAPLDDDRR